MPLLTTLEGLKIKREPHQKSIFHAKRLAIELFVREVGGQANASSILTDFHGFVISQSMVSRAIRYNQSVDKLYPLISEPLYEMKKNQWPVELVIALFREVRHVPKYFSIVRAGKKVGVITGVTSFNRRCYATVHYSPDNSQDHQPKDLEFL